MEVNEMEYPITRDYIRFGNSRSGQKISKVRFIVSHDTGNPGSTAYANRNYFDRSQPSASAHTFIDDKYVLEIIPLTEKAWHVRYSVNTDNQRFGDNANDAAIGVELCHGGKINFQEAYNRYVWYHAYLCDTFNLDPRRHIVAHSTLDPSRRSDPQSALRPHGISWEEFINDVQESYNRDFKGIPTSNTKPVVAGVSVRLPIRRGNTGPFVKEVQQDLIQAGFPMPGYGADGSFGPATERAVMRFQKRYGLVVDGLVGPATIRKLEEVLRQDHSMDEEFPLPAGAWCRVDTGEEVRMIQRALKHIHFEPKMIDGSY